MKGKTAVLLILMIISCIFYYSWINEDSEIITGKVVRVIDGDTVELGDFDKVRLKGLNAPESFMSSGDNSTKFLSDLVLNKTLRIDTFGRDKYDRMLGYLVLDDVNVNAEILRRGLATLYYYEEDKYYEDMIVAEEFARINELGIWGKSSRENCISLVLLDFEEPERLVLKNDCGVEIEVLIKDDATHIYEETLGIGEFVLETSHIWNDDGDSVYVYDDEGLVEFYRW